MFDAFVLSEVKAFIDGKKAEVRIVNPSVRYTDDGGSAERDYFYDLRGAGARAAVWHVWREPYLTMKGSPAHATDRLFPLHTGDSLVINSSSIERLHTAVSLLISGNAIVNSSDYTDSRSWR